MLLTACSGGNSHEAPAPASPPTPTVALFAGSTVVSFRNDGPALNAGFFNVDAMTFDAGGNLLIIDTGIFDLTTFVKTSVIRKISPIGIVSTLAALPPGSFLTRNNGIATDAVGNVYASSATCPSIAVPMIFLFCGGAISKVSPQGVLSTLQVNGQNALFNSPYGIAVDTAANIYVAEQNAQVIRKISPAGDMVTVVAASYPTSLAIDKNANLYVSNTTYSSSGAPSSANSLSYINKITPNGSRTTLPGSESPGTLYLGGIVLDDAGNLYIANSTIIRKITPAGVVTTIAGTGFAPASLPIAPGPLPAQLGLVRALAMRGSDLYFSVGTAIGVIHNVH